MFSESTKLSYVGIGDYVKSILLLNLCFENLYRKQSIADKTYLYSISILLRYIQKSDRNFNVFRGAKLQCPFCKVITYNEVNYYFVLN